MPAIPESWPPCWWLVREVVPREFRCCQADSGCHRHRGHRQQHSREVPTADDDQHAARHRHRHRPAAPAPVRHDRWPVRPGRPAGRGPGHIKADPMPPCERVASRPHRSSGWGVRPVGDALELTLAGASAIQVGTATFNDPLVPVPGPGELCRVVADRGARLCRPRRCRPPYLTKGDPRHLRRACARPWTPTGRCVGLDPAPTDPDQLGLPVLGGGRWRFSEICVDASPGRWPWSSPSRPSSRNMAATGSLRSRPPWRPSVSRAP